MSCRTSMRPSASSSTVPAGISFLAMATSSRGLRTRATSVMAHVAMRAPPVPACMRGNLQAACILCKSPGSLPQILPPIDVRSSGGHSQPRVPMASLPKTQYAKSGDLHIAYQVTGSGPLDLVWIPGFVSHLESSWEHPWPRRFLERLSAFSRLIRFDKRGTGLSDRVGGIPTLEERMDDVRAVMDAAGSERAALLGVSEGGPMSILFAATYPERTTALALYASYARRSWAPDHPFGHTEEE